MTLQIWLIVPPSSKIYKKNGEFEKKGGFITEVELAKDIFS